MPDTMTENHTMTEDHARRKETIIDEGKTKIIVRNSEVPDQAFIISKDDITAGDGAKYDRIEGKAGYATRTTCNVFRLLKACGIPVAFIKQVNGTTFTAPLCKMLPYEVVVRREAHGSFLKRMPGLEKGHHFPRLLLEFFLKTDGQKWKKHDLPCDDPLIRFLKKDEKIALFNPKEPIDLQKEPFLTLEERDVFKYPHHQEHSFLERMGTIARRVFLILEKAWQLQGRRLVDFKVEFGISNDGALLLADVIDNDSWRVVEAEGYMDKQVYRDGGAIDEVGEKYRRVAEITDHFRLPAQQIIIWCGSKNDDTCDFDEALHKLIRGCSDPARQSLTVQTVVCSMHKEPIRGIKELNHLVQQVPDTVVIAYVGRSNGAGPTLSASTSVPVITVPANYRDFPQDIMSSLRAPSDVPVATVLEPSNAVQAAVQILALHNPLLHMLIRDRIEERMVNTISI